MRLMKNVIINWATEYLKIQIYIVEINKFFLLVYLFKI